MKANPLKEVKRMVLHLSLKQVSRILTFLVFSLGIIVLIGWELNIEILKRINLNYVAMNPATALGFILCSLSLFLLQSDTPRKNRYKKLAYIFAGLVAGICFTLLFSTFTHVRLPIDQLLFSEKLKGLNDSIPNRMAPNTAFNFILVGLALLLINKEFKNKRKPFQYLVIAVALIGLLSIYGYIYGVTKLYGIGPFIPMAAHTAGGFVILSLAIMFARPHEGIMEVLTDKGSMEIIVLQIMAFFVPLIFGWVQLIGQRAGYYNQEFGTALFVIVTYLLSIIFLSRTSIIQHKLDKESELKEEIIRENEEQLRAVLNNIGEGVVVADTNGKFTAFNPAAEEILGIGAVEDPINKWSTSYGIFYPDEVTPYPSEELPLPKALKGESTNEVELFVRNPIYPDGRKICVTGRPVRDKSGTIKSGVVVFRNITEQKKLEKIIHDNEKRLQAVLSSIGDGIIVADINGKFLLFNKKAKEILGLGPTEGSFNDWQKNYGVYQLDGVTPFNQEDMPLVKALKGISVDNVEMYIKNKSVKEGKVIQGTGRPIFDDIGNVQAGVIDFHDVTDRKKLESEFNEIKGKYLTLLSKKRH